MNKHNSVLYIGVTSNIIRRVWEHRMLLVNGFAEKYKTTKLVYYESTPSIYEAIRREKQLKNWHKEWKLNLIKKTNPEFKDLYTEII